MIPYFLLRTLPSEKPGLRVVVSKKVSKKAVTRNLIRRRVKAVVGPLLPSLSSKLFIISAKPGAEGVRGEALKAELAKLFQKG